MQNMNGIAMKTVGCEVGNGSDQRSRSVGGQSLMDSANRRRDVCGTKKEMSLALSGVGPWGGVTCHSLLAYHGAVFKDHSAATQPPAQTPHCFLCCQNSTDPVRSDLWSSAA